MGLWLNSKTILVIIAIVVMLVVLPSVLLDGSVALLFGWIKYPIRLADERFFDWSGTALRAVCVGGLTLGIHHFGRWFASHRQTAWPWSRTFAIVGILMLMFLAGITGIGITHQGVWLTTSKEKLTQGSVRDWLEKIADRQNLRNLAYGSHAHVGAKTYLPAGGTFDANGQALYGWQTLILPYGEQHTLFDRIDLTVPWNDPINVPAMNQEIPLYLNPRLKEKRRVDGYALSHYAGNVHVLGVKPMTLNEITDGTGNTLLIGEVAHEFKPWGMPMNCRDPAIGLNTPAGFANPQGKRVFFVFADGTVRGIDANVNPTVLRALSTPRGGERIDLAELD